MEEVKTNKIIIKVPEDIIKKYDGFSILNLNDDYEVPIRSKIPENYLEDEQFDYGQNYEDNDDQEDFSEQNNHEENQNNQSNEENNDDDEQNNQSNEEDNNDDEQGDTYFDCAAYFKKIGDKYYIVYNGNIKPNNLNQIIISAFYYNINDGEYYWNDIILPITLENFAENSDKVIYVNINQNFDDNNSLTTNVEFKKENDCQKIINQYDSADKTDETIGREDVRKISNIIIEIENYNDKLIDNCRICEIDENGYSPYNAKISFEKIDNKLIAVATFNTYIELNKNNQIAIKLYNKNDLLVHQNIEFSPNPNSNEIPCIKFNNELSYTSGYLDISDAKKIALSFENTTNQRNNKIKRNLAIAIGIFLALGVAAVTALTFGWTLIPALLITKIAIGVGLALTIATFIYVAIKSKKIENDKCQNLGKSNSKDEISNNNDLDENNKNQKTDVLNNNIPNNLQSLKQNQEL